MRLRFAAALAALAASGCSTLTSTLPATAPVGSPAGVPTPAVALAALEPELARLERELERRVARREWGVPLQLSRSPDAQLRLRLGADETFDPGSAQLRTQVLALYGEIAAVLRGAAVVTHVLVHGDAGEPEPATGLTARRAAAVMSYLVTLDVPAALLRSEGRGAREPATPEPDAAAANRRVELVLKPIVRGQEPEAWRPPAPTGCGSCDAHG